MDLLRIVRLSQEVRELSTDEREQLLREIFKDEAVSATELLVAKLYNLEQFKRDAKRDIVKIAEAGMELGEREMRRVLKTSGNTRKKSDDFYRAMVRCLLDAGAFKGTKYAEELEASDFSEIDKDWYEWAWKPKTTKENK